jgi:uncharacterized cupin superfamily protein
VTIAEPDQWFDNPVTGQRTRIITFPHHNGGRRFALECIFQARSGRNALPRHVHPTSTETFEIIAGKAAYELGRIHRRYHSGDVPC